MSKSRQNPSQAGVRAPAHHPSIDPGATYRAVYAAPGPSERVYAVAFGRVWQAALAAARLMGRWTVMDTDPVRGVISVEVGGLLRKRTRPARVRLLLDDFGLTRVEATFLGESGEPAHGVERRQVARFHRQLEGLLRRDAGAGTP